MFDLISRKTVIPLAFIIFAILYRKELFMNFDWFARENEDIIGIFSDNKLARYNGVEQDKLYLAVLGTIFDVTEGKRHYQKGAGYHYFIGKDASRSFVTGNFNDETKEKDHVMDLTCNELFSLMHWQNTFKQKYIEVGKLMGRYYDNKGDETAYTKEFKSKIIQCEIERENTKKEDLKYPPCNIAWSEDEGTRVWCTNTSGGIKRSWTGVPRQLYSPGIEKPRCVCLNIEDKEITSALIKKYKDCPYMSTMCFVKT